MLSLNTKISFIKLSKKISAAILLSSFVFSAPLSAFAAARTSPFTPGQTLDPGLEIVEPCGPSDANCFPNATVLTGGSVTNIYSTTTNITSNATTTISGSTTVINSSSTNINSSSTVINSSSTTITGTTTVTNLVLGTLTGFLKAVGGVVSATSSISLINDVLGILGISKGGTGTSTSPTAGQILVGNSSGSYDLVSTTTLFASLATTSSTTNTLSFATATSLLTSTINGVVATTSITVTAASTTNTVSTSTNTFTTIVNGISSLVATIINSLTTSLSGNVLTTTVNGVSATSTVISNNTFTTGGNIATSSVNGVEATSTIINSSTLAYATATSILTSTINGIVATTTITAAAASTTNTISTTTNTFQTIVNGISSAIANIISSLTTSLAGNVLTTTVNGVSATSSVIGSNTVSFASTTGLLSSTINGVLATTTLDLASVSLGLPTGSNANGGSISSNVLTLSFADATNPGIVSTGTQTFAGDKTFTGLTSLNGTTIRSGNTLTFNNAANTFGTSFVAGNNVANLALTLPTADGADGTSLFTNGSGVLSFRSPYTFIARVAATTNAALATAYENGDTVDGVVLATGNIIILSAQTTTSENGVYTVNASGAPTRVVNSQINGQQTFVTAGTANITKTFTLTSTNTYSTALAVTSPITVQNTTSLFSTGLTGTGAGSVAVDSVFLGTNAGNGALNASYSNFFGPSAGVSATNALNSNFLGVSAGGSAANAFQSNFFGNSAGDSATGASDSNFFGYEAGSGATSANNSNFLGNIAGTNAVNASHSNFFGTGTGGDATNANFSNFIGYDAGNAATNASYSNFMGTNAGVNATNAKNSIFIGSNAGMNDTVNNTVSGTSILIGRNTNTGGFSNSIALGANAVNTAANQLTLGSATSPINQILTSGTLAINSGAASSLTLDSGTTGSVNLGTGANAKTISIGNLVGSTGILQLTGTAGTVNTSMVNTGNAFEIAAHSLTSGKGLYLQSSSAALTGDLQNITLSGDNAANTGNILNLTSSGANSLAKGLSVTTSGSKGLAALFSGAIAQASANYSTVGLSNNVAFGNFGVVRLTGATAQIITGIDDLQTSGTGAAHVDGRMLTIINAGTFAATIANASTSSSVNNRILTGTGLDFNLVANASINMIYDATTARWRVIGGSGTVTSYSSVDITNKATGGNIGTAATTVDVSTNFNVNQTTTLQIVTIPSPTDALLTKGKIITINNVGTADFQIGGITVLANSYGSAFVWTGTAWNPVNAASNVAAQLYSAKGASLDNTIVGAGVPAYISLTGLANAAGTGDYNGITRSENDPNILKTSSDTLTIKQTGIYSISFSVQHPGSNVGGTSGQNQLDEMVVGYSINGTFTPIQGNDDANNLPQFVSGSTIVSLSAGNTIRFGVANNIASFTDEDFIVNLNLEQISGNTPVTGQTVDYGESVITDLSQTYGSATFANVTGGSVTLQAGKTYEVGYYLPVFNSGTQRMEARLFNTTSGALVVNSGSVVSGTTGSSGNNIPLLNTITITPTVTTTINLQWSTSGGTMQFSSGAVGPLAPKVTYKQLGSTAATGVSFNSLTNAIAAGTLDNTNFAQTWNWSTATTETGLTMSANALTTGTIQKLTTSSTSLTGNTGVTGAGSLLDLNATGASTAFVGNLASIQNTGLTAVGNTGTALNINLLGTAQIMQGLSVTSASTGLISNGIARFNFTGAHSGNGVQIDDVTTSGNALRITTPSLTGGSALSIVSAGTTGTGSLVQVSSNSTGNLSSGGARFSFSGAHSGTAMQVDSGTLVGNAMLVNANSLTTGSGLSILSSYGAGNSTNGLLRVANTGAITNGTIFRAQSNSTAGSGLTVLANGNVGVGTSTPSALFAVQGIAVAQAWNTYSDRNLKDNILDISGADALNDIMSLNPVSYNFKGSSDTRLGFIAQDVENVIPSAISKDNNGTYTMNYMELISPAIKALQELNNKVFSFSTSSDISIEELTASTTLSVDTKVRALGLNVSEINDMLSQLASSTSATSTTVTALDVNGNSVTTTSNTFIGKIIDRVMSEVKTFLASATEIFIGKLQTNELCVKKSDGTNVCLTGDQLENVMNGNTSQIIQNTPAATEVIIETVSTTTSTTTSVIVTDTDNATTTDTTNVTDAVDTSVVEVTTTDTTETPTNTNTDTTTVTN